jgi:uncharacterized protein (TIGR03435 family)
MVSVRLLVVAGLIGSTGLVAQESAISSFQLVSIRKAQIGPCPTGERCIGGYAPPSVAVLPGGRFEARSQFIEDLARLAFGFDQIDPRGSGVEVANPKFGSLPLRATRLDVTAVANREWARPPAGEPVPAELRTMLRHVLETRFKLKARIETKNVDVVALRLTGAEPGPGLSRATTDCLGPYTVPPTNDAVVRPLCPYEANSDHIKAGSLTMAEVAKLLSQMTGAMMRAVLVDQTGLEGRYDLTLHIGGQVAWDRTAAFQETLRKQLGLKLVNAKAPVPILRIDHVENPQFD